MRDSSLVLGGSRVVLSVEGQQKSERPRLKTASKRPEGDLAPSQGHQQHCSPINPSLLYYFQIIFKWVKSLWGIKTLLNLSPISLRFNGVRAILSGRGRSGLRAALRRWSGTAAGQCENRDPGEGQQTRAQISSAHRETNKRIWVVRGGVKELKSYLS